MENNIGKQMDCLFAWAEFYSNSKNLETPTNANNKAFTKIQKDILKLKKQLID